MKAVPRRRFLFAAGALLVTLRARAQQGKKVPRIGVLITTTLEPFASQFRDELRRLGYDDGTTINIEFRMADGNPKILPSLAEELVRLKVDIIVASFTPAATAAK